MSKKAFAYNISFLNSGKLINASKNGNGIHPTWVLVRKCLKNLHAITVLGHLLAEEI